MKVFPEPLVVAKENGARDNGAWVSGVRTKGMLLLLFTLYLASTCTLGGAVAGGLGYSALGPLTGGEGVFLGGVLDLREVELLINFEKLIEDQCIKSIHYLTRFVAAEQNTFNLLFFSPYDRCSRADIDFTNSFALPV